MKYLVLEKSVKIMHGEDIGRDGFALRVVEDQGKCFVVVKFSDREFGIYKLSDVEITVCC